MRFLQAVKDKIVTEIVQEDTITPGGIVIPETARQSPHSLGKVISVGEEVKNIEIGDILMFHRHSGGQATFFEGKEIRVLGYAEIYCVIKNISE